VYCIHCKTKYKYDYHTFGHLGGFYCEKCGYKRHDADVALSKVLEWKDGSEVVEMNVFGENVKAEVMLPGGYNLYNALAATTVAHTIGLNTEQIVSVLGGLSTHFGRMEEVMLDDAKLHLVLVKNPAGFNEVVQFLIQQRPTGNIVFGLNDNFADGKDISWIYDVEFERLTEAAAGADNFFFTGKRAYDMQLRLKYADFDTEKFHVEKDYKTLITMLKQQGKETFLVLSYTCMLEFRDKLAEFVPLQKYAKE
jgi:UDP-N-acetylmuramyl tripeptide synthase